MSLGRARNRQRAPGWRTAVLEHLIERGCVTVVTTHHNALKLFGSETTGAVNAAMEFDPQTLKPTYRMIMGRPGRSYGLDMAARLGVPGPRYSAGAGADRRGRCQAGKAAGAGGEGCPAAHRNSGRRLAQELSRAQQDRCRGRGRASGSPRAGPRDNAKGEDRVQGGPCGAQAEAPGAFRVRLPGTRAELKKAGAEVEALSSRLEQDSRRERRADAVQRDIPAGKHRPAGRREQDGDRDRALHGGMLELEVGGKKSRSRPRKSRSSEERPGQTARFSAPGWSAEVQEEEGPPDRLNIIGLRVAEGLAEVDRFIDRAAVHHLSVVTVIHGLGTGALKTAVADFLKNHPLVASIRSGEPAEGGAGVTVAELKK